MKYIVYRNGAEPLEIEAEGFEVGAQGARFYGYSEGAARSYEDIAWVPLSEIVYICRLTGE